MCVCHARAAYDNALCLTICWSSPVCWQQSQQTTSSASIWLRSDPAPGERWGPQLLAHTAVQPPLAAVPALPLVGNLRTEVLLPVERLSCSRSSFLIQARTPPHALGQRAVIPTHCLGTFCMAFNNHGRWGSWPCVASERLSTLGLHMAQYHLDNV